jgi:galactokinase
VARYDRVFLVISNISRDFDTFAAAVPAGFFVTDNPVITARAPGRLDVMGGIADYSGSLVAEMPIAQATVAGVQVDNTLGGGAIVGSINALESGDNSPVALPAEVFVNPTSLLKWLREGDAKNRWAGYVAGCFSLLRAEGLVPKHSGVRIFIRSEVPLGAGVSSSAAIEVATMRALCAAFAVDLTGLPLARLCQRVENDIMDAPCGIMDQVTSAMGESGKLLVLKCQPHTIEKFTTLPDGWRVVGLDSRVKHSVGGTGYTGVRVAAFMGLKMLADRTGRGFGGYLCNLTPAEYEDLVQDNPLPETITGTDFLAKHGGILDNVTVVDPKQTYPVRAATTHPIYENARVEQFLAALETGEMETAGKQMLAAHASYSACGLGTKETDMLVKLAMQETGVVGAKITGGGSGGTVCVLCKNTVEEAVIMHISAEYEAQIGHAPRIIRGTSPGALAVETGKLSL